MRRPAASAQNHPRQAGHAGHQSDGRTTIQAAVHGVVKSYTPVGTVPELVVSLTVAVMTTA